MLKKVLSLLWSILLVFTMFAVTAFAEELSSKTENVAYAFWNEEPSGGIAFQDKWGSGAIITVSTDENVYKKLDNITDVKLYVKLGDGSSYYSCEDLNWINFSYTSDEITISSFFECDTKILITADQKEYILPLTISSLDDTTITSSPYFLDDEPMIDALTMQPNEVQEIFFQYTGTDGRIPLFDFTNIKMSVVMIKDNKDYILSDTEIEQHFSIITDNEPGIVSITPLDNYWDSGVIMLYITTNETTSSASVPIRFPKQSEGFFAMVDADTNVSTPLDKIFTLSTGKEMIIYPADNTGLISPRDITSINAELIATDTNLITDVSEYADVTMGYGKFTIRAKKIIPNNAIKLVMSCTANQKTFKSEVFITAQNQCLFFIEDQNGIYHAIQENFNVATDRPRKIRLQYGLEPILHSNIGKMTFGLNNCGATITPSVGEDGVFILSVENEGEALISTVEIGTEQDMTLNLKITGAELSYGDCNNDKLINICDLVAIKFHILGIESLKGIHYLAAD
ncbi:MAG: hypothetical protein RR263_01565, partial [Oscillospiraceae bacterium]